MAALDAGPDDAIERANRRVVERIVAAEPVLVDVVPAKAVAPPLRERALFHAGPPLAWEHFTGPARGACIGAVLLEGWAADEADALQLLEGGSVTLASCHEAGFVGPMGGITSGSMPVLVVEDRKSGVRAYCNLNEGIGRVLRFGAYGPEVVERLCWQRDVLAPALSAALRGGDGIALRPLMSRALTMGDEFHQRNTAASLLLLRELAPLLTGAALSGSVLSAVIRFLGSTDQFFLNVAMAVGKATMDAAHQERGGTLVTAMCRNGYEFAIRTSGTGDRWFTAPANTPEGLFFSGYTAADANPDIGDSAITETMGVGAFCMAAAPAVVAYVGAGRFVDAMAITREMREITVADNPTLAIPTVDSEGAPTGLDVRAVVRTGITPIINTGIAHREAGVGQIGAGTVRAPLGCFEAALLALAP
ncbi:MAG: DUF1116 domain-containing protein [Chloroflexi bacterium]|nr:DUF1116 domain-containing protein [Chloroflexota bacterium]